MRMCYEHTVHESFGPEWFDGLPAPRVGWPAGTPYLAACLEPPGLHGLNVGLPQSRQGSREIIKHEFFREAMEGRGSRTLHHTTHDTLGAKFIDREARHTGNFPCFIDSRSYLTRLRHPNAQVLTLF